MNGGLITVDDIRNLHFLYSGINLPSTDILNDRERNLRTRLNEMLTKKELTMYPPFKESNELVQIMTNTNNITQFRYD